MNRHYASHLGRFNQVDPLGMGAASLDDPQSLNLYNYVRNDPINFQDPTGLHLEESNRIVAPKYAQGWSLNDWYYAGMPWLIPPGAGDGRGISTESADAERRYLQMINAERDRVAAQRAVDRGDYTRAVEILEGNPNVGVMVNGKNAVYGRDGAASLRETFDVGISSTPGNWLENTINKTYGAVARFRGTRRVEFTNPIPRVRRRPLVGGEVRGVFARGSLDNPIHTTIIGTGAEVSRTIGWILQLEQPTTKQIQEWLSGTSLDL